MGQAAQADAVAGQHLDVELGVVQHFGHGRVFEHGAQRLAHQLGVELVAGVLQRGLVADGDVGGAAFGVGEGVAGDFAVDRIERGGFQVHRQQRRGGGALDPAAQGGFVAHEVVLDLLLGRGGGGRRAAPFRAGDALEHRAELELAEDGDHVFAVVVADFGLPKIELHGRVVDDRGELLGHERFAALLAQLLLRRGRLDLVQVLVNLLQIAPLVEQLHRALVAQPFDAGDVVGLVADDRLVVDDLDRIDAVAVADALIGVVAHHIALVGAEHVDGDAVADELDKVAVERGDPGFDALRDGLVGERGEHIVGLVALRLEDRHAEGLRDLAAAVDLRRQVLRHRVAVRLVVGVEFAAEGRAVVDVQRQRDVAGLEVIEHGEQRVGEAVDGADHLAGGFDGERLAHRVVGAEDDRVSVEHDEPLRGGRQDSLACAQVCALDGVGWIGHPPSIGMRSGAGGGADKLNAPRAV